MRQRLNAENLNQDEVHELHSLARFPPIGLAPIIDGAFVAEGATTCVRFPVPGEHSGRYHLTAKGKGWLYATADRCELDHCPCKDRSRETADVTDKRVEELIRQRTRQ